MKNVLILNRGEIAIRAINTCKRLKLKSFVPLNDCEADTLVSKLCDKVIHFSDAINPFMSLEVIRALISQFKIDMLYPGYGFLSEDPELAKLCELLNVIFIGPSSDCLLKLSSKKESSHFAQDSKLKTLMVENPSVSDFPLMMKASLGGGGRGNIICESVVDFNLNLSHLKKRALELFHSDDYILERYLPKARHVELQFVACKEKVYFLGTRDCSVQMKFQKFLEEGPSDESSLKSVESLYLSLEKSLLAMNYEGVGTIEFLWDNNNAYFMEVNTRIQVEHPITELLYDIDLVDIQFLIALDPLVKFKFEKSEIVKHAICARIYAVDTTNHFSPAPSEIKLLDIPRFTRFDTHYLVHNKISMLFDPLIGKLLVGGIDRRECIKNLKNVLSRMSLICEASNISFIGELLEDEIYLNNEHSVSYIESDFIANYSPSKNNLNEELKDLIWKKNHEFQEEQFKTLILKSGSELRLDVYRYDDSLYTFRRDRAHMEILSLNKPFWTEESTEAKAGEVSPITGKVVSVLVKDGDLVKRGQALFVLEAMKTQITISANSDFIIKSLLVLEGGLVNKNQRLFEIFDKG